MKAFRALALGYALLALLIAPAWIAAGERALQAIPDEPLNQAAATTEPVLDAASELATDGGRVEQPQPAAKQKKRKRPVAQKAEKPRGEGRQRPAERKQRQRKRSVEPSAKAAQSGSVTITDFEYSPATITVNVGDTVTWTNEGPTMHTATAEDGSFDTGNLDRGESGSATFDQAGTIPYICTPHPFMKGRVVVRAAGSGSPGGGSDTGGGGSGGGGTSGDDGGGTAGATSGSDSATVGGSGLPATGFEALMIGLLGMATLAAGLLLRRRSEA